VTRGDTLRTAVENVILSAAAWAGVDSYNVPLWAFAGCPSSRSATGLIPFFVVAAIDGGHFPTDDLPGCIDAEVRGAPHRGYHPERLRPPAPGGDEQANERDPQHQDFMLSRGIQGGIVGPTMWDGYPRSESLRPDCVAGASAPNPLP
jgi:hypothetical protein